MNTYTTEQQNALAAAQVNTWGNERREALAFLKQNPAVGMPASFGIGGDSYAMEIVGVEYFKTGAKAGQIKSVLAAASGDREAERFTMTKSGRLQKRAEYESYFYGSLTVGYALEQRDPSF